MVHINYHNITHDDMNNGNGLRVVLWLSGCSHHCYNCQNPQTWNPDNGILFDEMAKNEIFNELSKDYISGITLTGGDPLYKNNLHEVLGLIKQIRIFYPEKNIWLYTGYTIEQILNPAVTDDLCGTMVAETRKEIICNINVLVDGEYIDKQRDITKKWAGSRNQRVINVPETFKQKKIVLYCE